MNLPSEVTLREVAPRDGFQSLNKFLATDEKFQIVEALVNAGIRHIEATSFVSPEAIPQLRDAAELMSRVPRQNTTYAVMVPNLQGAQKAIAAKADRLVAVISATEAHNKKNVRRIRLWVPLRLRSDAPTRAMCPGMMFSCWSNPICQRGQFL
jgi:hydroxymethylglutaryl-CoA lyase